ncbi:MAG TPA: PAS domain-containing protein [Longimicrobium sp.]
MPAAHVTLDTFARPPRRPARRAPAASEPVRAAPSEPAPLLTAPAEPAQKLERRRRAWSSAVMYAAAAVIVLCVSMEIAPRLAFGRGAPAATIAVAAFALTASGVIGWRHFGLRSEAARLRSELNAAREAERWHRAVVNQVAEAVLIASPEGRLLESNQAAWQLLGRSHDELAGRRLWDLLPLDDRVVALRRGELVSTHGGGLRRLLRPDGSAVLADVNWSTLPDGRVVYLARPFK